MILNIALFIVLFIPSIIIFYSVYRLGISAVFNNIVVLTCIFFILIHAFMPFIQWKYEFFRYDLYSIKDYVYSLFYVSLLNLIYIAILSFFTKNITNYRSEFSLNNLVAKKILNFCSFVLIVGLYSVYINISKIFSMGIDVYLEDRISLGVGNGLTLLLSHWVYISALISFFIFLSFKGVKNIRFYSFFIFSISLSASIIYYSINSNRNSLFLMVISFMAIYFYVTSSGFRFTYRQLKKTIYLIFFVLLSVLLFKQLGEIRNVNKGLNDSSNYSTVQALNGAFGNHENIAWLLSNDYTLSYGSTYSAAITNFVPRSIWPDKPFGGGPILKNAIYPGSYVAGQDGNSSLTTGLYTEVIMNFGFYGSVLVIAIIAIVIGYFISYIQRFSNGIGILLTLFSIVTFSSQFLYAEFLGFLVRYIFSIIPLLICYFIQLGNNRYETNSSRYG